MQHLHTKLIKKYQVYERWHQTKHHNKIHWGVLAVFTLLIFGTISRWTPISLAADTIAPSTPTSLTTTPISSSQINLSWTASTDNVGVTGYKIYRCTGLACAPTVQIATSATNSYSNTGLTASTAYTYTVSAYDAAGNESGKSANASVITLALSANPIDNLKPGEWYEVPNSKIRSVLPNPIPPGGTGPTAIITAWNSGAYDAKRDRLIITGGGHNDYGGNEIYVFDIATLSWTRVWGPSPNIPGTNGPCNETYTDGNPASRHTYDGLEYLPNMDRFWVHGGSLYCGPGNAGSATWMFDFNTLKWARKADLPDSRLAIVSAYDPVTGHIFLAGPESWLVLNEYDPSSDMWTKRGDSSIGYGQVATIDPVRRKFITMGNGAIYAYDLSGSGTLNRQTLNTTGDTEIVSIPYPGVVYDPVSDKIVAWSGGPNVYTLDLATLVWTKHTTTGLVIPTLAPTTGTYGRWQYISSKNVFIGVNSIDENVWIYRLDQGTPLPSDTTLPSTPTNLQAVAVSSSQVNLSWSPSTDNVGVTGYRVYRNGIQIATTPNTSYQDIGLAPSTTYSYTVAAYDAAGNVSAQSASVSATTQALSSDTILPTVSITSPTSGQTVSGTMTISASASDNVSVVGVQFNLDGQNLGAEDTTAPYSISWNTTTATNGSHTLTAVARDAAGNVVTSAAVTLTVSNVTPPPPPSGQINIPTGVFVALELPDVGRGVGINKHATFAHNPIDGRLHHIGGDFSSLDPGAAESYQQNQFSLSIAERWANRADRNAGWRLEYPYCGPDGGVQPKSPDFVGWTWDPNRKVFWMVPGVMVTPVYATCPDRTASPSDDPKYLFRHLMTFNPLEPDLTKRWTDWGKNVWPVYRSETWMSTHDPQTDTLIRFGWDGGSGGLVDNYDIKNNTWSTFNLGLNALGQDIRIMSEGTAADFEKRIIYVVDRGAGRLHRYNMDTHKVDDLGPVPEGPLVDNYSHSPDVVWDSVNRVLLFFRVDTSTIHVYHPDTAMWESPPVVTDPPGLTPHVRHGFVFDPYQNVLALLGTTETWSPYIYLYRYANGSGTPLDTIVPSVPTNLSVTPISSTQINISWTASTDNVGVTGYKIYRCTGSGCAPTVQIVTSATNSYSNTGLIASTAYTYVVSAYDAAGNESGKSTIVSATTLSQFKQADFNKDGVVNQQDFDILKQEWNRIDKPVSDINQDGIVDSRDLGILMSSWEN